jgi:hypothetical protein
MKFKYNGSDCQYPVIGMVRNGAIVEATPAIIAAIKPWKHEFVEVPDDATSPAGHITEPATLTEPEPKFGSLRKRKSA